VRLRRRSYTAYSLGCALVWAAALGALAAIGDRDRLRRVLPVCGGWWIGWASATIARSVYPPPDVAATMGAREAGAVATRA
jgi:hypothetical protein